MICYMAFRKNANYFKWQFGWKWYPDRKRALSDVSCHAEEIIIRQQDCYRPFSSQKKKRINMLQNARVESCVIVANRGKVVKGRDNSVKWKQKREREREWWATLTVPAIKISIDGFYVMRIEVGKCEHYGQ